MDIMFTNVVGRLPLDGEWAAILNPTNQTYTFTTFHTGSGWDNGDPVLGYGQSAWFDLGGGLPATFSSIPMVPEPSAVALGGLAVAIFLVRRGRRAWPGLNRPIFWNSVASSNRDDLFFCFPKDFATCGVSPCER
jgi:hypothetical protein